MDPRNSIRNGFANGGRPHSHFYAAWTSRHEPSMIPKALKIATLHAVAIGTTCTSTTAVDLDLALPVRS